MVDTSFTTSTQLVESLALKKNIDQEDALRIQSILFCSTQESTSNENQNLTRFFWEKATSIDWIKELPVQCFVCPDVLISKDGYRIPLWPSASYLLRMQSASLTDVINTISQIDTNNPRYYDFICSLATEHTEAITGHMVDQIERYILSEYKLSRQVLPKLLGRLHEQGKHSQGLQLASICVHFREDPKRHEKQERRKEDTKDWTTSLEPTPYFDQWEYQQIFEQGIIPLIEECPNEISKILIDATSQMLCMRTHQDDIENGINEDGSEVWCRRLGQPEKDDQDSRSVLVNTMVHACEKMSGNTPSSFQDLNQWLKSSHWTVFKRLRQHLYAQKPSDQNFPDIRKFILDHQDYAKWEYHYEFQLMLSSACENFGQALINKAERTRIFDLILSGPSKENFRNWMGEHFTEERFEQKKRHFHRKQFHPFSSLLFGEYQSYFTELQSAEATAPLTDEDYSPVGITRSGRLSYRSPYTAEDIAKLNNDEILHLINEWEAKTRAEDDGFIEINIEALAGSFQTVFLDKITAEDDSLSFWIANRDQIQRPIYVKTMVHAMHEQIKKQQFELLDVYFEFCSWVLTHPEVEQSQETQRSDRSREHLDWSTSHRAVGDLVGYCVNKDGDIPITYRKQLSDLLSILCMQFDSRLDRDRGTDQYQPDQLTEAINNTRSLALENLIEFAFWIRRNDQNSEISEVTSILEERFKTNGARPLTMPEHALLGMHYGRLFGLVRTWAIKNKAEFFPQNNLPFWVEAFGSFLRFNNPYGPTYEILSDDFTFALDHLSEFNHGKKAEKDLAGTLARHLFTYYLWGVYPLKGDDSLLEIFYQKSSADPELWGSLFDHVGRSLKNSAPNLNEAFKKRIIDYFNWRIEVGEPTELKEFTFWLEAKSLDPDWLLDAYSQILKISHSGDVGISIELEALNGMLENHTEKVLKCFALLTGALETNGSIYVQSEHAKPILKAGLASTNPDTKGYAEEARENLLKAGRFEYLHLEEE